MTEIGYPGLPQIREQTGDFFCVCVRIFILSAGKKKVKTKTRSQNIRLFGSADNGLQDWSYMAL